MITRHLNHLGLAGLLFASAGCLAASPKETVAAFHAALAAGDRAKALSLLAPEVAIYESGHIERSRDEYASLHLPGDINFARSSMRKVLKESERIDGNIAIVWEESETTGMSMGLPLQLVGTGTMVLEKRGDAWTIVHVHWSSRKVK
ncbi:Calcium/calmodulin dependent protein kinase II [Massilia sp. LC238]|jgi:ketosteroid isomerase-like protein|nr:Calcium/calmodulin dependent protein kinase II [Massilia sp. LC238]